MSMCVVRIFPVVQYFSNLTGDNVPVEDRKRLLVFLVSVSLQPVLIIVKRLVLASHITDNLRVSKNESKFTVT